MNKDFKLYLHDILNSIEIINSYIADCNFQEFEKNEMLNDAVMRRLEIIGEASSRLPSEITDQRVNIPWSQIKALRNIIVHQYDEVDLNDLWNVIQKDLPILKKNVEEMLSQIG